MTFWRDKKVYDNWGNTIDWSMNVILMLVYGGGKILRTVSIKMSLSIMVGFIGL